MPLTSRRSTFHKLPSLDGWRALSIALVLGGHSTHIPDFPLRLKAAFEWLFDGDLGVRFFFLISGFLITWLLIAENERTARIHLKQFYIRRALRILPVYFAFLFVIAILQLATPYSQTAAAWAGNLTFTTNFVGSAWPSAHLWSLAVEEQFYLIWPCLFIYCMVAARDYRRAAIVLAVPVLTAPVFRVLSYLHLHPALVAPIFTQRSFLNYFDSLAIGCGGAILLARKPEIIHSLLKIRFHAATSVALGLIAVPYVLLHLHILGIITVPLGNSLQASGFIILLLQSIAYPNLLFFRVLNWSWVSQLGILSYSIYIWQQLFCTNPQLFGAVPVWWMSFPGWLLAVVSIASASYYGLERPLLKLRAQFRDP